MAIIGSILFLLMALLINLNFQSIKNLVERDVEERLLESASQIAQRLSNEQLKAELLSGDELATYLDSLALRLVQMSVPWNGYSLLLDTRGNLLAFPYQAEADWSNIPWQAMVDKALQENFDRVDMNFLRQPKLTNALEPLGLDASGLINIQVKEKKLLLSWSTIPAVGWKVVNVVKAEDVFIVKDQVIYNYRLMVFFWGLFLFTMFFVLVFLVFRRDQQLLVNENTENSEKTEDNKSFASLEEKKPFNASPAVIDQAEFISLVNGPLIICQFDKSGLIVTCNTAFEHLVGHTKKNLKGTKLVDLLGLKSLILHNKKNELELKIGKQAISSYWVSFHYINNQDSNNQDSNKQDSNKQEGLLLLLDINEYKQIQQYLMDDKQRANLAEKTKANFFKVAVNDANKLLLELIKNSQGLEDDLANYCQSKLLGLQYLLDDMQGILGVGSLEKKELSEDFLIIDLLVNDCYRLSKDLLADSGRCLIVEVSRFMPKQLMLDRPRLLALMRHLLRQVIQMSTKGDIYLLLNWIDDGYLQLTLQDQGGGLIESERLQRFQLTTPMSSSYEATRL